MLGFFEFSVKKGKIWGELDRLRLPSSPELLPTTIIPKEPNNFSGISVVPTMPEYLFPFKDRNI
jgi:hypothetical protein